jgi:hypothetical protein
MFTKTLHLQEVWQKHTVIDVTLCHGFVKFSTPILGTDICINFMPMYASLRRYHDDVECAL